MGRKEGRAPTPTPARLKYEANCYFLRSNVAGTTAVGSAVLTRLDYVQSHPVLDGAAKVALAVSGAATVVSVYSADRRIRKIKKHSKATGEALPNVKDSDLFIRDGLYQGDNGGKSTKRLKYEANCNRLRAWLLSNIAYGTMPLTLFSVVTNNESLTYASVLATALSMTGMFVSYTISGDKLTQVQEKTGSTLKPVVNEQNIFTRPSLYSQPMAA